MVGTTFSAAIALYRQGWLITFSRLYLARHLSTARIDAQGGDGAVNGSCQCLGQPWWSRGLSGLARASRRFSSARPSRGLRIRRGDGRNMIFHSLPVRRALARASCSKLSLAKLTFPAERWATASEAQSYSLECGPAIEGLDPSQTYCLRDPDGVDGR